ncbi:AAA family ATPase [Methanoplanus sp. FWC-SCC4]|uniref:Cytidylate kinase n=1 Tax=Methanochimaera problematica TaxID=2609417 RepID=A0AA97FAT6_9EURY|nr:AAA family ATPase [Methanoplanus sp. FWC-SCC4]WOF15492.1 AAA family ATPase [Methanoplanus sp. FWC-SCC4]
MRITVSGPPGSGTTSLAKHLSEKYSFELISAGEVFRSLASEKDMNLIDFGKLCEEDPAVDSLIDKRQKEIGEQKDNIIIEGRLAGHMIRNADLKIWVLASPECRAERIAERENVIFESAKNETVLREASEAARYKKYYDIDIYNLSIYDLVISSEKWNKEGLASVVDIAVENINQ